MDLAKPQFSFILPPMHSPSLSACLLLLLSLASPSHSAQPTPPLPPNPQRLNPPPGLPLPATTKQQLAEATQTLGQQIVLLQSSLAHQPTLLALLPDVQIFHNAVKVALLDNLFQHTNQFKTAFRLLELGSERATALAQGSAPWTTPQGLRKTRESLESLPQKPSRPPHPLTHIPTVRGFLSRIDGSIQPYGVLVPIEYLENNKDPRRLDVWLHGRADQLTEIAFLEGRLNPGSEFLPTNTFILHPYGRFMNAFKFAGETDVFESMNHLAQQVTIDPRRIVMRGFSMGGAGAWHLGIHHPGRFAAVNPGAGFVDVFHYQKLENRLSEIPWWEQKLWPLYDALACPINALNTTFIAYSGETDPQKAAADLMAAALQKEGITLTHIVGPKTGHQYESESRKSVARLVDDAAQQGIQTTPRKLAFSTYTLQFNQCHWLTIDALKEHWKEARVDAEIEGEGRDAEIIVTTRNVCALTLRFSPADIIRKGARVIIDGQDLGRRNAVFTNPLPGQPSSWWDYSATLNQGVWSEAGLNTGQRLAKRHGFQGPIDHAFMDSFLMVSPTGESLNNPLHQWTQTELQQALFHWRRFFRGDARVKNDRQITEDDIRNHHLILWGDPQSNQILRRMANDLPLEWTAQHLKMGGKTYDPQSHVPALIFPNPLNPKRYVVLNSGFTFPQYALDSNSLQTPKLPDWAVLDMSVPLAERKRGHGIKDAGFFGEFWEWKRTAAAELP